MPVIDLIDDQASNRIPDLRQVNDDARVRIDATTQGNLENIVVAVPILSGARSEKLHIPGLRQSWCPESVRG
jgi:hypothetical protein